MTTRFLTRSRLITVSMAALASLTVAHAQTAIERITHVAHATALDEIRNKPWHLKVSVTVFPDKSKDPLEGTIERWQSGADAKTTYTFGASTETLFETKGRSVRAVAQGSIPDEARELLRAFLHPGPSDEELRQVLPDARDESFGQVKLDCIMLNPPLKRADLLQLGSFPTYCMSQPGDQLRLAYDFGDEFVKRIRVGKFLEHDVTTEARILRGQTQVASGKVAELSTFTPAAGEFDVPSRAKPESTTASASGVGVKAGSLIRSVPPVYPAEAREAHLQGQVRLHGIIGRDGHMRQLTVISSPDDSLSAAAIAAARQWRYTPYTLNGMPSEVDTTVTVNFHL